MLWLIGLLVLTYFIFRPKKDSQPPPTQDFSAYDTSWINFIKSYNKVAKTKSEKALVARMLLDLQQQGYKTNTADVWSIQQNTTNAPTNATAIVAASATQPTVSLPAQKTSAQIQLDNASLLLYFGAFLLVASAGLFVAFGGLNGTLRTFTVLIIAFIMYAGGLYIANNRPRFKQAGLAFVGIGMSIAPLIGLAAYSYIFDKQNGATVWLLTSVLCLGMYTHALMRLRNPLLNYVFIFTFVSLFESSIAVVNLPIYYFGWGLAIVGLLLTFVSRYTRSWQDIKEPSANVGMLFLPLSLLCSLALITQHGSAQFGVSLLLAAAYYGLQAFDTLLDERLTNLVIAHVSALAGIAALTYGLGGNWVVTAVLVGVLNVLQLAYVLSQSPQYAYIQNFASVLLMSSCATLLVGIQSKSLLVLLLGATAVTAFLLSIKQKRNDAYIVAMIGLSLFPLFFASYCLTLSVSSVATILLMLAFTLVPLGVLILGKKMFVYTFNGTAQYSYFLASCFVLGVSFFSAPWATFGISLYIASTYIALSVVNAEQDWQSSAGLLVCIPLLWGVHFSSILLATTCTALVINILISLRSRSEFNRWLSAVLWLFLPLSLGLYFNLNNIFYTWAYFVAMLGLVFSRAIARGVVFVSNKVPLAAYAKNSSVSYEYCYWVAAVLAVGFSFTITSKVHTTILLVALAVIAAGISSLIEKRTTILVLVPLLLQGALLSAVRPSLDSAVVIYLLASTALAVSSYFVTLYLYHKTEQQLPMQLGALATVWIAPVAIIFVNKTLIAMPIGLLAASLLYAYHYRRSTQANKELAWAGVAVATAWFMYYFAISELQAYVHVVIVLFGIYAYWRHTLKQYNQSNQYLYAMLVTATLPLALQALQSQSGGVYGWWLLLEQIGFIILGMSIGKKFVVSWGLYVSVAAVLYQLRDLGWAALTVLALFIIGLAIYKIQKNVDK